MGILGVNILKRRKKMADKATEGHSTGTMRHIVSSTLGFSSGSETESRT